jgi:hypothetical protein
MFAGMPDPSKLALESCAEDCETGMVYVSVRQDTKRYCVHLNADTSRVALSFERGGKGGSIAPKAVQDFAVQAWEARPC